MEQDNKEEKTQLAWTSYETPKKTPARLAVKEALQPMKKKRGKPQMRWLKVIEKDIAPVVDLDTNQDSADVSIAKLESATMDRKKWPTDVKNIMERNLCR